LNCYGVDWNEYEQSLNDINLDEIEYQNEICPDYLSDHESDRDTKISGKEVFSWIENNDPETMAAYQRWLESLVFIMINLKAVLDPEKIVIGGGVSANQRFIEDLNREFCRAGEAMSVWKRFDMKIEQCRFRADANLIGALCVFREKYN